MSSEFFNWKSVSIEQSDLVLKIGTDAILLGSWIKKITGNPFSILDAGTGNGVIALMLSEDFPNARILAIDNDDNAVALAERNFRTNYKYPALNSRKENILAAPPGETKYDLIVSNPPYFFGQLQSGRQNNRNAKHAMHTLDEWIQGCAQRLEEKGNLCVIIPYESAFQWIRSANDMGLYCHNRVDISSFQRDEPVRTMLHFNKHLIKPSIGKLTIYLSANTYTKEYLEFTGIQPVKKI